MPANIVGPHGAGMNAVTTRPADTDSGSSVDTWFANCINNDPNTGTKVPDIWLNKVTALFRRAIRGMGVVESETDDDMLLKAIQKADRSIVSIGHTDAKAVYAGLNVSGQHQVRKLKAGANITLNLLEDGSIEIVGAAGGGGGGSPSIGYATATPHADVGYGGVYDSGQYNPPNTYLIGGSGGAQNASASQWLKVPLLALPENAIGASLVNGELVVPIGTYSFDYLAWFYQCGTSQSRLYNVTAGAVVHTSSQGNIANNTNAALGGSGPLTCAVQTTLRVEGFSAMDTPSYTEAFGMSSLRMNKLS